MYQFYRESERQRRRAEAKADLALKAVDSIDWFANQVLAAAPGQHDRQREFYRQALDVALAEADEPDAAPAAEFRAARGFARLGELEVLAGRHDAARAAYAQALARTQALITRVPDELAYRYQAVLYRRNLGRPYGGRFRHPEQEALLRTNLEELDRLLALRPRSADFLVERNQTRLMLVDGQGGPDADKLEVLRQNLEANRLLAREYPDHPLSTIRLVDNLTLLAGHLEQMGRCAEAEAPFREAVQWDEHMLRHHADKPSDRHDTRRARVNLGLYLVEHGRRREAEPVLREGVADLAQAVRDFPQVVEFQAILLWSGCCLGDMEFLAGRPDRAEEHYRRSLKLVDAQSRNPGAPWARAMILGLAPLPALRPPEQVQALLRDLEAVEERPDIRVARGLVLYRAGDFAKAREALEDGLKVVDNPAAKFVLALAWFRLGDTARARQVLAEAIRRMDGAPHGVSNCLAIRAEAEAVIRGR